jgi:hypothetical protein
MWQRMQKLGRSSLLQSKRISLTPKTDELNAKELVLSILCTVIVAEEVNLAQPND